MALPNQQAFQTGYQPNFGFYTPHFSQQHSSQNLISQPWHSGMQSFSPEPNFHFQMPPPNNSLPPPSSAPSTPVEWSPSPPPPPRQSRYQLPNPEGTADSSSNRVGRGGNITGTGRGGNTTGTRRGENTTGTARGQGRHRRGATRSDNTGNLEETPVPERGTEPEEGETAGRRKKGRSRAMNAQEKLVLIRECCEHSDEYKNGNKTGFWAMISKLLKDRTGYDLLEPRNTVLRWVQQLTDELVSEEMGSGTQVEQDDFKAAVEKFRERIEIVKNELSLAVKDKQAQAAELFEAVRLQRAMVFELDDEPIPGIDSGASAAGVRGVSIALNSSARKRKRADSGSQENASERVASRIAESLEKSTNVLASALRSSRSNPPSSAPTTSSLPSNNTSNALSISNLNTRITNMESELGDVKSMLSRILAAVSGGTTTRNENTDGEGNK